MGELHICEGLLRVNLPEWSSGKKIFFVESCHGFLFKQCLNRTWRSLCSPPPPTPPWSSLAVQSQPSATASRHTWTTPKVSAAAPVQWAAASQPPDVTTVYPLQGPQHSRQVLEAIVNCQSHLEPPKFTCPPLTTMMAMLWLWRTLSDVFLASLMKGGNMLRSRWSCENLWGGCVFLWCIQKLEQDDSEWAQCNGMCVPLRKVHESVTTGTAHKLYDNTCWQRWALLVWQPDWAGETPELSDPITDLCVVRVPESGVAECFWQAYPMMMRAKR